MNNVVLMGRLTRDPELRYLQGGNKEIEKLVKEFDETNEQYQKTVSDAAIEIMKAKLKRGVDDGSI